MSKIKNVGIIAGLIIIACLVGIALITIYPLPLPNNQQNNIGTVNSDGMFTASFEGAGYVIAETNYNNQHIIGSARIYIGNVQPPAPSPPPINATHIDITPEMVHLNIDETKQFNAQAFDSKGNPITGLTFTWSVRNIPHPPQSVQQLPSKDAPLFYNLKTILSIINITLITALLYIYFNIYHKLKSKFTIGLIITMFALIVYAFTSNPLLQVLFGFRAEGLGPFAMMPDLFATIALSILLYLSLE
jgi:hypothetical protein